MKTCTDLAPLLRQPWIHDNPYPLAFSPLIGIGLGAPYLFLAGSWENGNTREQENPSTCKRQRADSNPRASRTSLRRPTP